MKKCILCGKDTHGSVGAAGIKWDFICQQCKTEEDQMAWNNFQSVSKVLNSFFAKLEGNTQDNVKLN